MLDWRGLLGTTFIHGLAVSGWPFLGIGHTTHCLCSLPGQEAMVTVEVRRSAFVVFAAPSHGERVDNWTVRPTCGDDRSFAATPSIIRAPPLPRDIVRDGPLVLCATIDARGEPTGVRIVQAGQRGREMLRRIGRHIETIRFAPATSDERPANQEVELRLVA